MSEAAIVAMMFICFLAALFLGSSLCFVLGGTSIIFSMLFWGDTNVISMFVRTTTKIATNTSYVCVPLFILMGAALERSGASEKLFESIHVLMGRLRGGLAIATVAICAMMGAATGIVGASVTIMGMMALPAMLKCGYNKYLASGTVMSAGCLGSLIPPSVILIVYASLSQLSISKLFAGGMSSGLFLSALYACYIVLVCILKPEMGPPLSEEERAKYDMRKIWRLFFISFLPPIVLIIAVLGSIMVGVATPNEASALGAVGAFAIAVIYKKFSWKMLKEACYNTIKTTAMTMWVILAASMFTSVFLGLGGGAVVADMVTTLGAGNKWLILFIILMIIAIMGMLIDSTGILLIGVPLFTPILYPLGFDPLWFALLFAVMIQMSFISPPFAYAIFYLKAVAPPEITTRDMYIASAPFIVIQVVAIVFFCLFPGLITWLPSVL